MPHKQALSGVEKRRPDSVGFWTAVAQPVDKMCGERHESNQPPNKYYKES
jgi:hypothetical protein